MVDVDRALASTLTKMLGLAKLTPENVEANWPPRKSIASVPEGRGSLKVMPTMDSPVKGVSALC